MKRLLSVFVLVGLCPSLSSCVTTRDQVAVVRGAKFAAAEGSPLGQAVASELGQVALDIGAVKLDAQGQVIPGDVDPAQVPLEVAAAQENAQGIAADREARSWLTDLAAGALGYAKTAWPPLGVAMGAIGGLWALWRKLKGAGAALATAKTTVTAAVTLTQRVKEALADKRLTLDEFKALYDEALQAGPAFVDGAAALKAEYDRLKAEWRADGTPIRSLVASAPPVPASPGVN